MEIVKKHNLTPSRWSGGTTAQLFIYPKTATYDKRDFEIRISTATVDTQEAEFTPLPGVMRVLMVLKGSLELSHTGQYNKKLHHFDKDSFSGEWSTHSKGRATDFNVMVTGNRKVTVEGLELEEDDLIFSDDYSPNSFLAFYVYKGKVNLDYQKKTTLLSEGDLVVFGPEDDESTLECLEEVELVVAIID
ncbi:MAG: HutD family protein [Candidatus Cloacimonetes bacterium]|nr:HutD family protein [Candidatus Cloacimonadota bacterium]